jgi:hypothetical protein
MTKKERKKKERERSRRFVHGYNSYKSGTGGYRRKKRSAAADGDDQQTGGLPGFQDAIRPNGPAH